MRPAPGSPSATHRGCAPASRYSPLGTRAHIAGKATTTEKVKNFFKEAKLSDQLPFIIACDRFRPRPGSAPRTSSFGTCWMRGLLRHKLALLRGDVHAREHRGGGQGVIGVNPPPLRQLRADALPGLRGRRRGTTNADAIVPAAAGGAAAERRGVVG
ncbi:hypothetical protein C8R43DRAFT_132819 [Mycena crocata]|nr:hypothetical protein C8R43DRAFT_132819 [Mycena crocata]